MAIKYNRFLWITSLILILLISIFSIANALSNKKIPLTNSKTLSEDSINKINDKLNNYSEWTKRYFKIENAIKNIDNIVSKWVSKKKENTLNLIKNYLQKNYTKPDWYDLVKNDYYSLKKVCEDNTITACIDGKDDCKDEDIRSVFWDATSIYKCEKDGFSFYQSNNDMEDAGFNFYDENWDVSVKYCWSYVYVDNFDEHFALRWCDKFKNATKCEKINTDICK